MKNPRKLADILLLAGYVALIYSTLSMAPPVFRSLDKALGESFKLIVNLVIVLIAAAIFTGFSKRLKGRRPVVYVGIMAILLVYILLMACLTPKIIEKVHLLEYGLVGYLAFRIFRDMGSLDMAYFYSIITVIAVGYTDELIQGFLPNRVYDIADVYLNVLGGLLGLALMRLVRYNTPS